MGLLHTGAMTSLELVAAWEGGGVYGLFKVRPVLLQDGKPEFRSVPVPPHRFTPLKENWMKIFTPIVEHLKLQIRLNLRSRHVELRVGRWMVAGCLFSHQHSKGSCTIPRIWSIGRKSVLYSGRG